MSTATDAMTKSQFLETYAEARRLGDARFNVAAFRVTQKTASRKDARTDASFDLAVRTKARTYRVAFQNLPHNEREAGKTDKYTLVLTETIPIDQVLEGTILMRVSNPEASAGRNAWLPSHIKVVADLVGADSVVLIDRPWPSDRWFSGDRDESVPSKPEWDLAS